MILIRRYGRLPILFWSQVRVFPSHPEACIDATQFLAMIFLLAATLAPNLKTFAGELLNLPLLPEIDARSSDEVPDRFFRVRLWHFSSLVSSSDSPSTERRHKSP